uniref:Uncharacterized protein n=1 Tax=Meloidogyne hapla TaxID=6305 RepID=A0A1I8BIW0_MELHA
MKILIILFPLFSFLLIILNNFVISISLLQFKLEHHFTIKIDFNNINIKCKIIREDNENLEINFVPNSNASHLYQGEVCPNNEYVLTIKNNIINTKCPSPYRHNQGDEFVTLYKIMINTEGCKKDIRKTSTELIQTDFDFNNQSRGGFNNFDDLINLIDSKINFMNNYYTKRNEKRDFIFEDWQQLGQIYIIEYLINLPIFTQSVDFGIKLHDLNMLKCGFELIDPDHPVVEKWSE